MPGAGTNHLTPIPLVTTIREGRRVCYTCVRGAPAIDSLAPGDRVLIAEACSHHPIGEDSCRKAGLPITNYGLSIAYSLGIFERALGPFPAALEAYRQLRSSGAGR